LTQNVAHKRLKTTITTVLGYHGGLRSYEYATGSDSKVHGPSPYAVTSQQEPEVPLGKTSGAVGV